MIGSFPDFMLISSYEHGQKNFFIVVDGAYDNNEMKVYGTMKYP
ncbi:MAG: hypothetical protein ACP5IB_08780 [Thermoplasmata archaeon]